MKSEKNVLAIHSNKQISLAIRALLNNADESILDENTLPKNIGEAYTVLYKLRAALLQNESN